jgi:hypothetical protein
MTMTSTGAPVVAPSVRPLERIEAEMVELSSQIAGATCRLLLLVGEYDATEGWRQWGMNSTAAWLSWQCGVGMTAAGCAPTRRRPLPGTRLHEGNHRDPSPDPLDQRRTDVHHQPDQPVRRPSPARPRRRLDHQPPHQQQLDVPHPDGRIVANVPETVEHTEPLPHDPSIRADAVSGIGAGEPCELHTAVSWLVEPTNSD